MNVRILLALLVSLVLAGPDGHCQKAGPVEAPSHDSLARVSKMAVQFFDCEEVPNPETKRKEWVVHLRFPGIPIPSQPLVLRRGDKVAGYLIGELKNPGVIPNDVDFKQPRTTLEITHIVSGEKFVMELGTTFVVYRDK